MPDISAQLIVRIQEKVVRAIALSASPFTIGRNPDNMLPLQHSLVSRYHAELRTDQQQWTITDLNSSNGTVVNGSRLLANQPRLLQAGDTIRIGPVEFLYQPAVELAAPPDHPAEVTPPPPAGPPGDAPPDAPPPDGAPPETDGQEAQVVPIVPAEAATLAAAPDEPCFGEPIALPTETTLPPRSADSRYLRFLPILFQDNDFLRRYLLIFESIWEPLEERQTHMEMYIDPRTCPTPFLAWLASWLDLSLNAHWPEARRRKLLAEAMNLYRWRGTSYGLARMIEVCTGLTAEISDGEPLDPFVFRIRLHIPPDRAVDLAFVEALVRAHKPAHAGYILEPQP